MLPRLVACLLAAATQSCVVFVSTGPTPPPNVVIILTPGTWVLCADRTGSAVPGSAAYPQHPSDPLREGDYRTTAGVRYSILVTAEGRSVSITASPPINGTRTERSDDRVTYALSGGLAAGGRLVVWKEGTGYQGELTVYGSGVPVVKSERGAVVRASGS